MKKNKQLNSEEMLLRHNFDYYPARDRVAKPSFYKKIYKFKNIEEFLKDKKKKARKRKQMKRRKELLMSIASGDVNYHYSLDDQTTPILPDKGENLFGITYFGLGDSATLKNDFDDKTISNLNYGQKKDFSINEKEHQNRLLDLLEEEFKAKKNYQAIRSSEPPIKNFPDGILPVSDSDQTYKINNEYGVTNLGNTIYSGIFGNNKI